MSAWVDVHTKFSKLPFEKLFEASIYHSRNSFLASSTILEQRAAQGPLLVAQPRFAEAFLPAGQVSKSSKLFSFPPQAGHPQADHHS